MEWMMAIQAWFWEVEQHGFLLDFTLLSQTLMGRCPLAVASLMWSSVGRLGSSSQHLWHPLPLQTASSMLSAGLRAAPSHRPGNVGLTRKQYWEGEKGLHIVLLSNNHKMNSSDVLLTSWGFYCSLNAPFLDEGYCLQVLQTRFVHSADYGC